MKIFVRFFKRKKRRVRKVTQASKAEYIQYKVEAKRIAEERLAYFNLHYKFTIGTIRIRNQRTRWGSCSSKGNISLSYRIATLPPYLADYILVHELCHIGQFNHSQKFWDLVAETMPHYMQMREELKKIRIT
ncbi:MAG: M48 family metallopeptidase [Patescibacteria group bacterium]